MRACYSPPMSSSVSGCRDSGVQLQRRPPAGMHWPGTHPACAGRLRDLEAPHASTSSPRPGGAAGAGGAPRAGAPSLAASTTLMRSRTASQSSAGTPRAAPAPAGEPLSPCMHGGAPADLCGACTRACDSILLPQMYNHMVAASRPGCSSVAGSCNWHFPCAHSTACLGGARANLGGPGRGRRAHRRGRGAGWRCRQGGRATAGDGAGRDPGRAAEHALGRRGGPGRGEAGARRTPGPVSRRRRRRPNRARCHGAPRPVLGPGVRLPRSGPLLTHAGQLVAGRPGSGHTQSLQLSSVITGVCCSKPFEGCRACLQ